MHRYTSWSNNTSRSYKAVKVLFFRGLYLAKGIWGVCKAIRQLLGEDRYGFLTLPKKRAGQRLWFLSTRRSCSGVSCPNPVVGDCAVGEQFISLFRTAVLKGNESPLENFASFCGLWRELRQLAETDGLTLGSYS